MKTIDARGLSCPEPVVLTRNALRDEAELEVLVDSPAPRENVSRFAAMRFRGLCQKAGWEVELMPVPRSLSSSCGTCASYVPGTEGALLPAGAREDELELVAQAKDDGFEVLWRHEG
ncbi:sulfurtransferase TusA family protein [Olsenella phocaeensis]|uniref:sulfurtransferase TusA family protein n=1 Tax=Olsenella phocaeensis TaxID=1852385 RepID=UPI0009303F2F|nr:sulfurtransferase TusA family protein [Olsenella phocaeensis]